MNFWGATSCGYRTAPQAHRVWEAGKVEGSRDNSLPSTGAQWWLRTRGCTPTKVRSPPSALPHDKLQHLLLVLTFLCSCRQATDISTRPKFSTILCIILTQATRNNGSSTSSRNPSSVLSNKFQQYLHTYAIARRNRIPSCSESMCLVIRLRRRRTSTRSTSY